MICLMACIGKNIYGQRKQINAGDQVIDHEVKNNTVTIQLFSGYLTVSKETFIKNFGIPVAKPKSKHKPIPVYYE